MPSTYTPRNRLTKQATGENVNTWGLILNAVLDLIDFSLDGVVAVAASAVLTTANGAVDQARGRILNITAPATVTIPSVEKFYLVRSVAASTITNGSNSVSLSAGEVGFVITDGTGIWKQALTDMAGQRLKNLGAPTAATDAATRKYVDDTAFTAAGGNLPGQSGNTYKFLQSQPGEIAGWGLPTVEQIDGLTAAIAAAVNKTAIETAVGGPVALLSDQFLDISSTTHTLTEADNGKVHRFTSATAVAVALPNGLSPGWNALWAQVGAGQVTFTPGSGATRRNANNHTKSRAQYSEGSLRVDTNAGGAAAVYFLSGDTAA